jgi:RNA polymerase sigma factor (sigma-70 family)
VEGTTDYASTATSLQLLARARHGDREALEQLFQRLAPPLYRWARGRLPQWARRGADTADLVQDALVHTFQRLDRFEPRRRKALQAYLRQAVRNRVRDELRRADTNKPPMTLDGVEAMSAATPLEDQLMATEDEGRYRAALQRLEPEESELVVARLELGYSYEQLALAFKRPSADAARMAVRRALLRVAEELRLE